MMENKDINLLGIGQNMIFHTQVTVVVCGIITTNNDIFFFCERLILLTTKAPMITVPLTSDNHYW